VQERRSGENFVRELKLPRRAILLYSAGCDGPLCVHLCGILSAQQRGLQDLELIAPSVTSDFGVIIVSRSLDSDIPKEGRVEAVPINEELVPYLKKAMTASPSAFGAGLPERRRDDAAEAHSARTRSPRAPCDQRGWSRARPQVPQAGMRASGRISRTPTRLAIPFLRRSLPSLRWSRHSPSPSRSRPRRCF
jgi:hypothetical protein